MDRSCRDVSGPPGADQAADALSHEADAGVHGHGALLHVVSDARGRSDARSFK